MISPVTGSIISSSTTTSVVSATTISLRIRPDPTHRYSDSPLIGGSRLSGHPSCAEISDATVGHARMKCPDGHRVDISSAKWTSQKNPYCRERLDLSTAPAAERAIDSRNVQVLQRHRCEKMSTSPCGATSRDRQARTHRMPVAFEGRGPHPDLHRYSHHCMISRC